MNSKACAAAFRRLGQVGPTPACMRQAQVSCLIPLIHPGTVCHHINHHKFRTIKPHLRRNQIRALVLRRTPSTLLPHRQAEVAVVHPDISRKQHRPSSSDRSSLSWLWLFLSFILAVQFLVDRPVAHIYKVGFGQCLFHTFRVYHHACATHSRLSD
jgi:hypothetical protein